MDLTFFRENNSCKKFGLSTGLGAFSFDTESSITLQSKLYFFLWYLDVPFKKGKLYVGEDCFHKCSAKSITSDESTMKLLFIQC